METSILGVFFFLGLVSWVVGCFQKSLGIKYWSRQDLPTWKREVKKALHTIIILFLCVTFVLLQVQWNPMQKLLYSRTKIFFLFRELFVCCQEETKKLKIRLYSQVPPPQLLIICHIYFVTICQQKSFKLNTHHVKNTHKIPCVDKQHHHSTTLVTQKVKKNQRDKIQYYLKTIPRNILTYLKKHTFHVTNNSFLEREGLLTLNPPFK